MIERPDIAPLALENLEKLGRFWSFPRKKLAAGIRKHLQAFQALAGDQHTKLLAAEALAAERAQLIASLETLGQQQRADIASLGQRMDVAKEQLAQFAQRLSDTQEKGREVQTERDQARALGAQLQARQVELAQRIGDLEAELSQQTRELESSFQSIAVLQETNKQWESSQAGLQQNLQHMTNQHLTLREKFELVQRVLALEPPANTGLGRFAELIEHDYLQFAAQESSLADEAGALLELQAIHRELELVVNFPGARGKTLLAVAGGFSSGKSRFINSFITGESVKLAVGMNPVTVVPSYVVCSDEPQVRGYAANGGSLTLSETLYTSLSHEYLESFGFDLRKIMPFISVKAPMDETLFRHLCLIDTPGYNPGGGHTVSGDHNVAQRFAGQASAMIWVIGIDNAGTITQSDLSFIEQTNLYGQSLYILLNKADAKSASAIEGILDQVKLQLESYGFEFAGICGYSSRKNQTFAHRGQTLAAFLAHHNKPYSVLGELEARIDGVFDRYEHAIDLDLTRQRARKKHINVFKLETMKVGGTVLYQAIEDLCEPLAADSDEQGLTTMARECSTLRKRFKEAVRNTLAEVLAPHARNPTQPHHDAHVEG
jgi:hypothetical protein